MDNPQPVVDAPQTVPVQAYTSWQCTKLKAF